MSAPQRTGELSKLLLDSMAKNQPSSEGRRRAALALGLSPAVPLSPPGETVPRTSPPSGGLPKPPGVSWPPYLQWAVGALAVGAVATAALVAGGYLHNHGAPSPSVKASHTLPEVALPPRATAPTALPSVEPQLLVPARALRRAHRSPASSAPVAVVTESPIPEPASVPSESGAESGAGLSSLSIETTLLDATRDAVRQHATSAAFELLKRYEREVPAGVLRAEADALRIEATLQSGDRAEAARLAERFFEAHRDNALGARVRALLENSSDQKPPLLH